MPRFAFGVLAWLVIGEFAAFPWSDARMAAMESLSARLAGVSLPDSEGNQVRLGSIWADSPAVVVFLRHYGWIFCREHVAQLREHEAEISPKGDRIAGIGFGGKDYGH